jgi:hypothetical protein
MKINSSTNGKRISLPYRVITIINWSTITGNFIWKSFIAIKRDISTFIILSKYTLFDLLITIKHNNIKDVKQTKIVKKKILFIIEYKCL